MSPQQAPESGWYPDPRGAARTYRWWDGARWTAQLTDDPSDAAPASAAYASDQDASHQDASAGTEASPTGASPAPSVPSPAPPVRLDPALSSAYARPPRDPDRRPLRPDRVVAAVALAIVLVAVSLVVVLRADGVSRDATLLAPPSPVPSGAVVGYDTATREARVGDVVATFPTRPFANLVADPATLTGLFTGAVASQATVQAKYDGTDDWTATILLGSLDPQVVKSDEEATARATFARARTSFYSGVTTTSSTPKITTTTVTGGRRVVGLSADLSYAVPKVESTSDRVVVLVIAPPTGSSDQPVAWISARPNRSDEATSTALQAALDTLRLA